MSKASFLGMAALALVVMLFSVSGCGKTERNTEPQQEPGKLETAQPPKFPGYEKIGFMSAPPTGSWYPMASAIAGILTKELGVTVTVEPGGGSANIIGVNDGQHALGIGVGAPAFKAWEGQPPFDKKNQNVRFLINLWNHYTQIGVLPNSPIRSFADLKRKKINVAPKGYASEVVAQDILKAYGWSYDDVRANFLNEADGVEQLKDGNMDAVMMTPNLPYSNFIDVATTKGLRLISLDKDKIQKLTTEINRGLRPGVIPAGMYKGIDYPVDTVVSSAGIIAKADMPDDLAYLITKAVVEHFPELRKLFSQMQEVKTEDLYAGIGIPIHPGAERYFKEKGWLK